MADEDDDYYDEIANLTPYETLLEYADFVEDAEEHVVALLLNSIYRMALERRDLLKKQIDLIAHDPELNDLEITEWVLDAIRNLNNLDSISLGQEISKYYSQFLP